MPTLRRISLALKAAHQLGLRPLLLLAAYRLKRSTGWLRLQTPIRPPVQPAGLALRPLLALPARDELHRILGDQAASLLAEADEITAGQVRLFGGPPVPLELSPAGGQQHWTAYEGGPAAKIYGDIKYIWEPARFGWAFTLGRAYHLSGNEHYPQAFWHYLETFWEANPPNRGPNWVSAQEVALRLMAFTFAAQVFAPSKHSTLPRLERLAHSIAAHAARIPPTLEYARAQHNNHLLSEAAGLLTASLALPDHPQAARWSALGRKWLNAGLRTQLAPDGTYCQHSANYHRLMLQLALWVKACQPEAFDDPALLAAATRWLLELLDPLSGQAPNLGHNDGAYVLPLAAGPFGDYRPVLQAASAAFLGKPALPNGVWDEMSLWLKGQEILTTETWSHPENPAENLRAPVTSLSDLSASAANSAHAKLAAAHSWGYLRAVRYTSRPGQADPLHFDLWWRGLNVALDAGTYRYTAEAPWENALASIAVHNTITVEGQEPMTRSGKFLWLDWVQSRATARQTAPDEAWQKIAAEHDGYRRFGITHRRAVTAFRDDHWLVEDTLLSNHARPTERRATLHWLLADWPWEITPGETRTTLRLHSPQGWIHLRVTHPAQAEVSLARGGQMLYGNSRSSPVRGWTSPTYGTKIPVLSLAVAIRGAALLTFTSEWIFP